MFLGMRKQAKEMMVKILNRDQFGATLAALRKPYHENYLAMYSSVLEGIVTDPVLMLLPIDDHMVHRGDGIFETFKCVEGAIYNLNAHLDRLERSAANLAFTLPVDRVRLHEIIAETIRVGGARDCAIRLFVSRGPGSFGVNPYDAPAPQLYIVITRLGDSFMVRHPEGAVVRTSAVPLKHPFFAGVKHCNYLNNVLMKKEAVEAGVDFVVGFDASGRLGEGATENIGVVTQDGTLVFPRLDGILMGTTMMRVMELAQGLVKKGLLREVRFGDLIRSDVTHAREMLIVGTTIDVTRVREFDGKPVGDGSAGRVYQRLRAALLDDIHTNAQMRTPILSSPLPTHPQTHKPLSYFS